MKNLDYDDIQALQENTTKKLIKYINEFIQKEKVLDTVEFYYPDYDEQKAKIAFNVWISIDYRTNEGKSFIEHMLEDWSSRLTGLEKEILIERNKSFISLFEVENIKDNNIYLLDLLTRKQHIIWDPNISNLLNPTDLIFGRIGKIINYKGFIGNISFLPSTVKDMFVEKVLLDYNRTRFKYPNLSISEYLKKFSINVYRIYTECFYEVMDNDEDMNNILYDELNDFEFYLETKESPQAIKTHIANLIELFEYYFINKNLFLLDFDQLDMEKLIMDAIRDGFIFTKRDFTSYLSTLKKYLYFLKNQDPVYIRPYEDLLKISKNRFFYMAKLREIQPPFNVDVELAQGINYSLNDEALSFIADFEKFLLLTFAESFEVTEKKKYIKKKHLIRINDALINREEVAKANSNQRDFPLIHFFYLLSISKGMTKIDNNKLNLTYLGHSYQRLSDEEKFSLMLQFLWSEDFLKAFGIDRDIKGIRIEAMNLLTSLEKDNIYRIDSLHYSNSSTRNFITNISYYLNLMGLLNYNEKNPFSISLTSLGKLALKILSKKDEYEKYNGKVIHFGR